MPTIFAATQAQEPPIVPEPVYPAGIGNAATDLRPDPGHVDQRVDWRADRSRHADERRRRLHVRPTVILHRAAAATGATARRRCRPPRVASVNLRNTGGFGYTSAPAVSFSGGGGTGASATAALGNAGVRSITVTAGRQRLHDRSRPC